MNTELHSDRDPLDILRRVNPVPAERRAQLAAELDPHAAANEVMARAQARASRRPSSRLVRPWASNRRLALIAAIVVVLAGAGSALGIGLSDYLSKQAAVDNQPWTPPEMKAVGARVELARGTDWAFMAWRSTQGICVAYAAGTADGWARSCGFVPGSGPTSPGASKYLGVLLTSAGGGASDGLGAIVGAVVPAVAKVDLELSDGRVISAETQKGPSSLNAGVRFFLVRTPLEASQTAPPGLLRVTSITSYAQNGTRLERFSTLR